MSIELSLAEHHAIDKIRHENDGNLTVMLDDVYILGVRAGMERAAKLCAAREEWWNQDDIEAHADCAHKILEAAR